MSFPAEAFADAVFAHAAKPSGATPVSSGSARDDAASLTLRKGARGDGRGSWVATLRSQWRLLTRASALDAAEKTAIGTSARTKRFHRVALRRIHHVIDGAHILEGVGKRDQLGHFEQRIHIRAFERSLNDPVAGKIENGIGGL